MGRFSYALCASVILFCMSGLANELRSAILHEGAVYDCLFFNLERRPEFRAKRRNSHASNMVTYKFTIRDISIETSRARKSVQLLNIYQTRDATVHVEHTGNRLKVVCTFDPQKVDVDYFTFNRHPRLTIRLYHIDELKHGFVKKRMLHRLKDPDVIPRIVVDCGHGGFDWGAPGVVGVPEKDVNLAIGLKVIDLLQSAGAQAYATRADDSYLRLEERTKIANDLNADLFIAIHINGSPRSSDQGILAFTAPRKRYRLVNIRPSLRDAAADYERDIEHGRVLLANCLGNSLSEHALRYTGQKKFLGVMRTQAFQVLMGTHMPSVLLELGYLSNKQEATLLTTDEYQEVLAHAIVDGVIQYVEQLRAQR